MEWRLTDLQPVRVTHRWRIGDRRSGPALNAVLLSTAADMQAMSAGRLVRSGLQQRLAWRIDRTE